MAETRQSNFEQGIAYALHLWPDLTLAVTNELGGPESADKRDWLAGAVSELFPPFPAGPPPAGATRDDDIDNPYIQEFLQGVMEDEFEVVVEEGDPSLWKVAEQIVRIRKGCAAGDFSGVEALRERWAENRGRKVEYKRGPEQESESDEAEEGEEDSESEGGADLEMDEAPSLVRVEEKSEPLVDEDGFTKVTRKRK